MNEKKNTKKLKSYLCNVHFSKQWKEQQKKLKKNTKQQIQRMNNKIACMLGKKTILIDTYFVQPIIGINFSTVTVGRLMSSNNPYRNTTSQTVLQSKQVTHKY